MSSKAASMVKAPPGPPPAAASSLPITKRRRESSDDFNAAGSLGSIAGSATSASADAKPRASSLEFSIASKGSGTASATGGINNGIITNTANNNLPAPSSASSSPSGRKPFRKRNCSVDFTLSIDDNDSVSTSNLPQLLPQHASAAAAAAPISASLLPSSSRIRNNSDATGDSASLSKILPSMDALPPMEALPPIDDASSLLLHPPTSPLNNSATGSMNHNSTNPNKERALSFGSSKTEGHGLDHLDSLGVEAAISAARIRKESISERSNRSQETNESNASHGTLNSQSQRFLLEAFLGDGTESLVLNPSQRERLGSFDAAAAIQRERLGSFDAALAASLMGRGPSTNQNNSATHNSNATRDSGGRRDRLESWGGMSDLSATGFHDQNSDTLGSGGTATAAALAATIYSSLAKDVSAAAGVDGNDSVSSFFLNDETIPTKISVNRDRLNSVASMATDPSALFQITTTGSGNNNPAVETEFPSDVQKYVKAAMASVEDQLADLATTMEAITRDKDQDSEVSSAASPMIGAASDIGSNRSGSATGRPRSSSLSSLLNLAVDYDAVAAAVDAAEAAAGAVDLTNLAQTANPSQPPSPNKNQKKRSLPAVSKKDSGKTKHQSKKQSQRPSKKQCTAAARKAPPPSSKNPPPSMLKIPPEIPPIPRSKLDERDMEKIRERARAAAGYVPPSSLGANTSASLPPLKKRTKLYEASASSFGPSTPATLRNSGSAGSNFKTPVISNAAGSKAGVTPVPYPAYSATPQSANGQSSQKWESMFECLLGFIEDRKKEETVGLTEAQKKEWVWDGNVPTTYKTKDGKALGRWVNNQRSAKSKGTLKEDREVRLLNAGLKWSVLASSSWNEMLEELKIYIADQAKQGKEWDGNVPTNYRIKVSKEKAKAFAKDDDEDKNLGRWVNRQRSMYQAGRLRKDRQLALEKIGLKWSMLATTSWDSMFETLCEYVDEKRKNEGEWDGNVPANYKTDDNPPRALGRWINRQRSANTKNKLKPEYVSKLTKLGLKWSVHERRPSYQSPSRPDAPTSSVGASQMQSQESKSTPLIAPSSSSNGDKPSTTKTQSSNSSDSNDLVDTPKPDSVGSTANNASTSEKIQRPDEEKLNSKPSGPSPSKSGSPPTVTGKKVSQDDAKSDAVDTSQETSSNPVPKLGNN